ncbi:uncharacterized protein LOC110007012 [Amborella trichopoda]|uniref:Uncharacterized protein n=1 Tax=Amborella trichopoda TaxID=13333 RepID=W1P0I0_AMBTC|nr:uncharacterized protein LOC110007012 [Amborella trichopoda]ERN03337.1 hypothetical protein AMTR_s00003p00241630 [Amborella trichopoda]|eukprot:XP_020521245.1 uncharacterized protein LOC110007012 [Amborella trichopoda]
MDFPVIHDAASAAINHLLGLGFPSFYSADPLAQRHRKFRLSLLRSDSGEILTPESFSGVSSPSISATLSPLDAAAPPPVKKRRTFKAAPRALARKTKCKPHVHDMDDGNSGEGFDNGKFGDGDGSFGGGRWNYGGGGGGWDSGWEEPLNSAFSSFFYEVIGWIALSHCVHFSLKKLGRFLETSVNAPERVVHFVNLSTVGP